jgi:hypothetical protein
MAVKHFKIDSRDEDETLKDVSLFYGSSPFDSWLGPAESKDPMAIDARERGEYSAESLLPDEE